MHTAAASLGHTRFGYVFGPEERAPRRAEKHHGASLTSPGCGARWGLSLSPLGRVRAASAITRMETPQPARPLPQTRPFPRVRSGPPVSLHSVWTRPRRRCLCLRPAPLFAASGGPR